MSTTNLGRGMSKGDSRGMSKGESGGVSSSEKDQPQDGEDGGDGDGQADSGPVVTQQMDEDEEDLEVDCCCGRRR